MTWPAQPTFPQPGDTPEVFNERAADVFNYLAVVIPLVAEMEAAATAFPTITGYANYIGLWADQTGGQAVPASVYHNSLFWALTEDVADITTKTPGVAAEWVNLPSTGRQVLPRAVTSTITAYDLPLDSARNFHTLMIESVQHDQTADRALMVAFSTDGGATYGTPTAVSAFADNATDLDVDLTFFLSATTARSLHSSALGNLGLIVPADADAIRIGVGTAGEFNGKITKGAVDGTITLTAYVGQQA
jgi:hypothetical protein